MRNKNGVSGFEAYLVIAQIARHMGMTPAECFEDIERKIKQITEEMENDRNQGSKEA